MDTDQGYVPQISKQVVRDTRTHRGRMQTAGRYMLTYIKLKQQQKKQENFHFYSGKKSIHLITLNTLKASQMFRDLRKSVGSLRHSQERLYSHL